MDNKVIMVENTRFIFQTNFSGDPSRDRFADARRKANLIIPDPEQAKDLIKAGFKVRETKPGADDDPEEFVPEYFVSILVKYRNRTGQAVKYPPRVYLVSGDNEPLLLDEESISCIDNMRIDNVNVVLNSYTYDPVNNGSSLYVRTMYVEQDLEDDPYAARYASRRTHYDDPEDVPF